MKKLDGKRRETPATRDWYRTLLRSYLYRPPLWVYLIELAVAALMVFVIIFGGDEHVINILAQVLWGHE